MIRGGDGLLELHTNISSDSSPGFPEGPDGRTPSSLCPTSRTVGQINN